MRSGLASPRWGFDDLFAVFPRLRLGLTSDRPFGPERRICCHQTRGEVAQGAYKKNRTHGPGFSNERSELGGASF